MKDLYTENYKTLLKEIEENIKKWKDSPCSCIGRINIVKMALLPKAIYRSKAIYIILPMAFFTEIEKNSQICMEPRKTQNSYTNPEKKNKARNITMSHFKVCVYYKATVIKTV